MTVCGESELIKTVLLWPGAEGPAYSVKLRAEGERGSKVSRRIPDFMGSTKSSDFDKARRNVSHCVT